MSAVTKAIGLAKKLKHRYQDELRARTPVYLSPVRRIEQVRLPKRICAMTFDDGPCRLPANPSKDGKPLTLSLLESLEQYGARAARLTLWATHLKITRTSRERKVPHRGAGSNSTTTPISTRTRTAARSIAPSSCSAS